MKRKFEMLDYILESKVAARQIVENSNDVFKNVIDGLQHIEQIYLVGSGTSYHAALASKRLIENKTGIRTSVMYAMQFYEDETILKSNSLLIGISHAGRSSSTIVALNKAKEHGMTTISMSAEINSPVMEASERQVLINIGEELAGPKTKGYIGSIVTLNIFGLKLGLSNEFINKENYEKSIEEILEITDTIPAIFEAAMKWYDFNKSDLINSRRIIVMGYGNNLSATMEGALKVSEAVRYAVFGYEMEEFMHGIYHGIDKDTYIFYLNQPGPHSDRCLRLKEYFKDNRHNHNYLITSNQNHTKNKDFYFDFKNYENLLSLEYVVVLQVLARRLSSDLGIDCNLSSDPNFHKKMESYSY